MDTTSTITWLLCSLTLVYLISYIWRRRFLYYYASKLPGPLSVPILGSVDFLRPREESTKTLVKACESYPPIFKIWIGSNLCIVNSEPEDVYTLLNTCLEKSFFHKAFNVILPNVLARVPVSKWKGRRKALNQCFHPKVIDSLHDSVVKYSNQLVDLLDRKCGQELTDILTDIWKCLLDSITETIVGLDPVYKVNLYQIINLANRGHDVSSKCVKKWWLLFQPFWRLSRLSTEAEVITRMFRDVGREVIMTKKEQMNVSKDERKVLQFLINLSSKSEKYTEEEIVDESLAIYVAATETTATTLTYVLLVLALFPEIQNKICEEILSVTDKDLTLEDTNRLEYLERVIKETMRLFPIGSVLTRSVDRNIQLGSYVFPAGSTLLVPVEYLHRRPDLWPEPLKFDPDRFLPENVEKRHRCAYLPFSFGPRNCIGFKYAMMSLKVMTANVVKNFKVQALNYRSLEDIQHEYHFTTAPVGYRIMFTKRTK